MKKLIGIVLAFILILTATAFAKTWQDFLSDLEGENVRIIMIHDTLVEGTVVKVIVAEYREEAWGKTGSYWVLIQSGKDYVWCQIDNILLVRIKGDTFRKLYFK